MLANIHRRLASAPFLHFLPAHSTLVLSLFASPSFIASFLPPSLPPVLRLLAGRGGSAASISVFPLGSDSAHPVSHPVYCHSILLRSPRASGGRPPGLSASLAHVHASSSLTFVSVQRRRYDLPIETSPLIKADAHTPRTGVRLRFLPACPAPPPLLCVFSCAAALLVRKQTNFIDL